MGANKTPGRASFLFDIFTTACEGGITYWCDIKEYHWHHGTGDGALDNEDVEGFFANIIISDDGDESDGDTSAYRIDKSIIQKGIDRIISARGPYYDPNGARTQCADLPHLTQFIVNAVKQAYREVDAGSIDAHVADCIVQAGLFNDVMYG